MDPRVQKGFIRGTSPRVGRFRFCGKSTSTLWWEVLRKSGLPLLLFQQVSFAGIFNGFEAGMQLELVEDIVESLYWITRRRLR